MRNELVHPVTTKEIVNYLEELIQEKLKTLNPGDMSCILLEAAKDIVEKHGYVVSSARLVSKLTDHIESN